MHKNIIFLIMMLRLFSVYSQRQDAYWMMGYGNNSENPAFIGATLKLDETGIIQMDTLNRKMNIERAFSAISDSKVDLLFYTNGNLIANKNNDTLGRLYHTDTYPMPNDTNLFWLFHFTAKYVIESSTDVKGWNIYQTLLDKRLNNGMGGIVYNSQIVLTDTLALMGLTAVKHANG